MSSWLCWLRQLKEEKSVQTYKFVGKSVVGILIFSAKTIM
jgi:hypothetical protein